MDNHAKNRGILLVVGLIYCLFAISIQQSFAADGKREGGPGTIVVTEEDIERLKVHSVVELLNQLPGVSATESMVSFRGSTAKTILVLLNGRPLNNPADPHRAVDWSIISLKDIKRIEVHKGMGSVTYGEDTSGGVISITTKTVSEGRSGNIEAAGGSFNTQLYDLNFRQAVGAWNLSFSGGWERSDGYRTNGDKDKRRAGAKAGYQFGGRPQAVLSVDYSKTDRGSPGRVYSPTPHARYKEDTWGSTLVCPIWILSSKTHFNRFTKNYRDPDNDLETDLETWDLGQDLKTTLSAGALGQVGMGAYLETAHAEGSRVSSQDEQKYALFATKDIHLKKIPLNLGLGLRANSYSEFRSAINPQVQLTYEHSAATVELTVNRSNNTPTFHQRYYESTFTRPNPDLEMETALNYSLSLSSSLKKSMEGSLTLFLSKIDDRISYVKGDDGVGAYLNSGSVTRKGIETSAKWSPHDRFQARCSYTYLLAEDDVTGKYLTYSSKHQGNLDLQYRPIDDLSLTLSTKYVSKRFVKADNSEWIDGYSTADFRADYALKKWNLFLKITNLFDSDYDVGDGYPGSPIACTLGVGYEF